MRLQIHLFIVSAVFLLTMGSSTLPLFAQQEQAIRVGKKGDFHLNASIRVSDTVLKEGMYQIQHVAEGGNDVIIFREILMGYRSNMGNQRLGKEVARVKCRIEPTANEWKNTKLILRANATGEKEVLQVQIKGEKVKHLF